jgi:hypothetical protein
MSREVLQNPDSMVRHAALHHGYEMERAIPADPYLTLPFNRQELSGWVGHVNNPRFNRRRLYNISEGTIYSPQEQRIHGKVFHAAVDYDVPYGSPVVAPTAGYVVSSYESFWLTKAGRKVTWKGMPIAMGLGYVVQLYDPNTNRFLQFGHLSTVDASIPFSIPEKDEDGDWHPTNLAIPIGQIMSEGNQYNRFVQRGQPIGLVGWSGLRWGYDEYRDGDERPTPFDHHTHSSYDEPHLHVEEFFRNQTDGSKTPRRDIYDIYLRGDDYPTPTRKRLMGPEPLFYLGHDELPKFADDRID